MDLVYLIKCGVRLFILSIQSIAQTLLPILLVEFSVEKIEEVEWNGDAFANLVLPSDRKNLLQSLVEAHHQELGFDDFIKGKGHGLVINLFGPPGVGKSCLRPLRGKCWV